jgi:hypothetical protein
MHLSGLKSSLKIATLSSTTLYFPQSHTMKLLIKQRNASAAMLLLMLVGCIALGVDGKKNLLQKVMSDGDAPTVDYDAATGTVTNDLFKVGASCDGQLASALVKAKEIASNTQKELDGELAKHKASLETIVDLQKDLAQTNTKLVEERDALSKLKETLTESLEMEKSRSKEELEAQKAQAQKELVSLRGEKDDIIASLKEEWAQALEAAKESADKKFQDLKTEKDEMISALEAKLKMSSRELQSTMSMELEKAKEDKEKIVAEITADRDATVAKLTTSMQIAASDAAELLLKTQEEATMKLAAVEADRDAQLATLTQNMEEAAKESAELLQTTKNEAKATLLKQKEAAKRQGQKMATEYEKRLSQKNENIKNLQESIEKLTEEKATIERVLEEANSVRIVSSFGTLFSYALLCISTIQSRFYSTNVFLSAGCPCNRKFLIGDFYTLRELIAI